MSPPPLCSAWWTPLSRGGQWSPEEGPPLAPVDRQTTCSRTMMHLELPGAIYRKHQKQADRAWVVKPTRRRGPRGGQVSQTPATFWSEQPRAVEGDRLLSRLSAWVVERPWALHVCSLYRIFPICEIATIITLRFTGFVSHEASDVLKDVEILRSKEHVAAGPTEATGQGWARQRPLYIVDWFSTGKSSNEGGSWLF